MNVCYVSLQTLAWLLPYLMNRSRAATCTQCCSNEIGRHSAVGLLRLLRINKKYNGQRIARELQWKNEARGKTKTVEHITSILRTHHVKAEHTTSAPLSHVSRIPS